MRSRRTLAVVVLLAMTGLFLSQSAPVQQVAVSFQLFYDELGPHGIWVEYPQYGYVWIPRGIRGFHPYATAGHWVLTEYGWTWVSDYPWGWAVFHYGRWDYDSRYGWFWVPGTEWGPAWVSWRRCPGYYGWAPLRPGVSISMAVGGGHAEINEDWVFVKEADVTKREILPHIVNRKENAEMIRNSTVVANTQTDKKHNATYIAGPQKGDFEHVTKTSVKTVAIKENEKPGNQLRSNELRVYRPAVKNTDGKSPAPSKVMKLSDMKPREGKPRSDDGKKKGEKKDTDQ